MLCIALIIILLAVTAFLVWACATISSGVWLKAECRGQGGRVYLTFDDGPEPGRTEKILDVLAERNAKAVFFLIGSKIEGNEALVERMLAEGHRVGIHSWSHSWTFPLMSVSQMSDEIERCGKTLEGIAGGPVKFFRPPFGVVNPTVARVVRRFGLRTVGWSIRTFDTSLLGREGGMEQILEKVAGKLDDGAVILLHDRLEGSAELLGAMLDLISGQGYSCDRPFD
ncbi:MAG: polysaccharide deacetylase family protein [Candidatus Cryptobacteroides sp.]